MGDPRLQVGNSSNQRPPTKLEPPRLPQTRGDWENYLRAVDSGPGTPVWTAGDDRDVHRARETLVAKWNGQKMYVVKSRTVALFVDSNYLDGIAAVGARDGWVVGRYEENGVSHTLIERFVPCA